MNDDARPDRAFPDRPHVAVGVVVLNRHGALLIQRGTPPRKGQWSIPGGGQELGETVRETAVREVSEETGVQIECGPLVDVLDTVFRTDDGRVEYHYTLVDFAARVADDAQPRAGEDVLDARFVPLEQLDEYGLWDETRRIILAAAEILGESAQSA